MINLLLLLLAIALFIFYKAFFCRITVSSKPGFIDITSLRLFKFYKLDKTYNNFMEWASAKGISMEKPKIWSRLIFNSNQNNIQLEDKNYRASCFKNRRRFRKARLIDGDIYDVNGKCFLYFDPSAKQVVNRNTKSASKENIPSPNNNETSTDEFFNFPYLQPLDSKQKSFFIDKNEVYIGRSLANDLVIRSPLLASHHAIIKIIQGKARLISLSHDVGTYVNSKKIDEINLSNNDEISFNSHKYKYISKKIIFHS